MKKISFRIDFIIGGLIILIIMLVTSCRKEADTVAKITVIDVNGNVIPDASVRLYPTPSTNSQGTFILDDTLLTRDNGVAIFDYTNFYNLGQAGFAVLDIEVNSGDTIFGAGIIKIVEEELNEETVIVQ